MEEKEKREWPKSDFIGGAKKFIAGGIPALFKDRETPATFGSAIKERFATAKADIASFQGMEPEKKAERMAFTSSFSLLEFV